jgi:hypothetical protein
MASYSLFGKYNLRWKAPRWSSDSRGKRAGKTLFNSQSLVRIGMAAALLGLLIVALFKLAFPLMPLINLWWLGVQIPVLFGYVWIMSLLHRCVGETITIYDDLVLISSGSMAIRIPINKIHDARITIFRDDMIRLKLWYERRGNISCRTLGLDQTVPLGDLEKLLNCVLRVRDARHRTPFLGQPILLPFLQR